jgi:hypothetical protein
MNIEPAVILPADFILVTAVTKSELPVFFSASERPDYVPDDVFAIFPAHVINQENGTFHHYALVRFGGKLGELLSAIASLHAAMTEADDFIRSQS